MIRLCFVFSMLVLASVAQDTPPTGSWLNPRIPIPSTPRLKEQFAAPAQPATVKPEETAENKAPARCAHIITFVPPKDADNRMVIVPGSRNRQFDMPVTPALPVCTEDIRQLPEMKKK